MTRAMTARVLTAVTATLAMLVVVVPASDAAASKKVFHESLAISSNGNPVAQPLALNTSYTFAFTLTNDGKSPQAFGSGEILVPSGYTLGTLDTDATNFTATPFSGGILLTSTGPTGSGIAPGGSVTVTAVVGTPVNASCGDLWPTYVKQSNDFSGSGNDFQPADPAPSTTVGPRTLVWSTQPATTEWDVAMSPAPVVTAKDPCGNTLTSFTGAGATVTVTDAAGVLSTGGSVAAGSGVATFSNLTFSDYGLTDALTASAAGFDPVTSSAFDVVQSLVPCAAGRSCSTGKLSDRAATTIVEITADAGAVADRLTTTVKGDPSLFGSCGQPSGSTEPALGTVVTFNVTSRSKTVTMTLPRSYVNQIPNNGTPFMDICLDVPASAAFVDKFGSTVTTGLLPDCSATRTTVCINDRRKNAGNEIITFVLPPGDPRGSWF